MKSNCDLSCSLANFRQLIRTRTLPPKMQAKLRYLQTLIASRQVQCEQSYDLPQFQKMSLKMMNKQTKVALFNSIVQCLSGNELITYFSAEKAWIKLEGSQSRSTKCYLFLRSDAFKVSRTKDDKDLYRQILVDRLMVQKIYRKVCGMCTFKVGQKGQKYIVNILEERVCAKVHGQLLNKVRQRRNLKVLKGQSEGQRLNQGQQQTIKNQDLQFQKQEIDQDQIKENQEKNYLMSLANLVQSAELTSMDGFQTVKKNQLEKLMVNRVQKQVKVMIDIQRCSVKGLVQSYMQFGAWNVQVQKFQVVNRIRRNTFLGYLKIKKQGMFSAPRQTYLTFSYFKQCKCTNKANKDHSSQRPQTSKYTRSYLIINSTNSPSTHDPRGAVTMSLNQIVEFSQIEGKEGWVFVNILSKMDFNVWQYLQSSIQLSLSFMNDVNAIGLLSIKRQMIEKTKKELFDYESCKCLKKYQKKLKGLSENDKNSVRKDSIDLDLQYQSSKTTSVQVSSTKPAWPLVQVLFIIDSHNRMMRTDRIVSLITSKINQKYYLKQHFPISSIQQPYISSGYSLKARQNYLGLGLNWKLTSSQDYIFINEQQLKIQKGVIKLVVKQVSAHIMAGKSIMTMSLPVQIFDNYSALQSFARIFGFVPVFMHRAVLANSMQQQIKFVGLAFMSLCSPMIHKPFNPILGQTFEGVVGGIRLYFQQISHHPPISTFFMKTDKFQAHGSIDIVVDIGLNSARTKIPAHIKLKIYSTNAEYVIKIPDIDMDGVMFGSRTFKLSGLGYVLERKSGLYLQWSIGRAKKGVYEYKQKIKSPDLAGGVFEIAPSAVEKLLNIDRKKVIDGIKPDQIVRRRSVLTGKWYGDALFDGVLYKSLAKGPFPVELQRPSILLPSDCSFRLDIVYRRWKEYSRSNEEKEILENLQRNDRKLREKYHSNQH